MKVLVADDDADLLDVTTYALRRSGFEVLAVRDGLQALRSWKESSPDLVLVDFDLPGLNGLELCREIRQHSHTPVVILSEHSSDDAVIHSFQMGADDYVLKPVSHRQLAMRIRAIVNRASGTTAPETVGANELRVGKLRLDLESHEVTTGGSVVRLTPIEFRIFYQLLLNAGRVVNTSRLIDYAWGYNGADAGTLKMHVSRIRQKVGLRGSSAFTITSIRWVGYVLKENGLVRAGYDSRPTRGP